MKKLTLLLIIFCLFLSCNKQVDIDRFTFETKQVNSKFLALEASLIGIKTNHSLQSSIRISNIFNSNIIINDIAVSTPEGIWTSTEGGFSKFQLAPSQDTTLTLSFYPINNSKLFQFTGQKGLLQPNYTMRIDFVVGTDEFDLNVENKLSEKQFNDYKKTFSDTLTAFSYKINSNYVESQKAYESKTEGYRDESNFINLSKQELAMTGMNFKLYAFQKKDTIHSQLSIVNHSDLDVMIDTTLFGFHTLNQPIIKNQIRIDKISGSQLLEERKMIRKGDRIIVNIKQPAISNDTSTYYLALKNVFILKTRESLFFDDIALDKDTITNY